MARRAGLLSWGSFVVFVVVTIAVAAAEQEDEAVDVVAQVLDAVGGVADKLFQRCAEAAGVAGQPLTEEGHHLGEFSGIGGIEDHAGQ